MKPIHMVLTIGQVLDKHLSGRSSIGDVKYVRKLNTKLGREELARVMDKHWDELMEEVEQAKYKWRKE